MNKNKQEIIDFCEYILCNRTDLQPIFMGRLRKYAKNILIQLEGGKNK